MEQFDYVGVSKAGKETRSVKVEALVDNCSLLGVFGVEVSHFRAVVIDEVSADSSALVQVEAIVVDERHVVLAVHPQKLRLQQFAAHQIDDLQVDVHSDEVGRHHDGPARRAGGHVIQIDCGHVASPNTPGTLLDVQRPLKLT